MESDAHHSSQESPIVGHGHGPCPFCAKDTDYDIRKRGDRRTKQLTYRCYCLECHAWSPPTFHPEQSRKKWLKPSKKTSPSAQGPDAFSVLEKSGILFSISVPQSDRLEPSYSISAQEALEYISDPIGFKAKLLGAEKEHYAAWHKLWETSEHGVITCQCPRVLKSTGAYCKNPVGLPPATSYRIGHLVLCDKHKAG